MNPPASNPPASAADRLVLSRERIRLAMTVGAAPKPNHGSGASATGGFKALQQSLLSIPGSSVLIEAVRSWWSQHPLRLASMVAAEAATAVARPLAQRHPLGLLFGALLLGGLLAWSRPWRWIFTPALLAGLLPQVVSKAMTLVPPSSWMAVLNSLMQEPRAPRAPTAAREAAGASASAAAPG